MKKNFDIRLAALREYLRLLSADETVFIVEAAVSSARQKMRLRICVSMAR